MTSDGGISVIIGTPAADYVPLIVNAAVTLIGGALAAIGGGYVGSLMTAKANREHASQERKLSKEESQRADLFSVHYKLIAIYSNVRRYREHLGQSRVRQRGREAAFRCSGHTPFSTDGDIITFTSNELNTIYEVGGDGLLGATASLDLQHNSILQNFALYRAKWFDVHETTPKDGVGQGTVRLSLTREQFMEAAPKFMLLDQLLNQLDPMVDELEKDVFKVIEALLHARFKKFGFPRAIMTVSPQGQAVTIQADANAAPLQVGGI